MATWNTGWEIEFPATTADEIQIALVVRDLIHGASYDVESEDTGAEFAVDYTAGDEIEDGSYRLLLTAEIDGAGAWKKFRKITLPLLTPLLTVVTVFSTIWTFADFQLVWIITKGGPAGATHIFGTLSFQRAMQGGQFGEGAAISNFMLPILVACVFIAFVFLRRED